MRNARQGSPLGPSMTQTGPGLEYFCLYLKLMDAWLILISDLCECIYGGTGIDALLATIFCLFTPSVYTVLFCGKI